MPPRKRPIAVASKRKRVDDESAAAEENDQGVKSRSRAKRSKASAPAGKRTATKKTAIPTGRKQKIGQTINSAPATVLDIFVFGEGSGGELGLGSKTINGQAPTGVMRPRLNPLLSSTDVGVVHIACGGMHAAALTRDNKILTWGVNDHGALGRNTNVEEDGDDELNPAESTPGPVDTSELEPDVRWAQVVASDNATFALTQDGKVYGWGTFRASDGIMGFNPQSFVQKTLVQRTPVLITDLKDVRQLAAGNNHVLALDGKGKVYAWGCGEHGQLARRVFEHHPEFALRPTGIGALPVRGAKAVKVACGSYHSFVLDQEGRVYGWGLNSYAELAIADQAGEDNAFVLKPCLIQGLSDFKIVDIAGGEHHSLACTDRGELLTWGRIDGHQVGLRPEAFTEENTVSDSSGKPRILKQPTVVPDLPTIASVGGGTDHSFALTVDGTAYSWGFSANGRTGHGTEDDIEVPIPINNTAVRDKKLIFAGGGGRFSVLASVADVGEGV